MKNEIMTVSAANITINEVLMDGQFEGFALSMGEAVAKLRYSAAQIGKYFAENGWNDEKARKEFTAFLIAKCPNFAKDEKGKVRSLSFARDPKKVEEGKVTLEAHFIALGVYNMLQGWAYYLKGQRPADPNKGKTDDQTDDGPKTSDEIFGEQAATMTDETFMQQLAVLQRYANDHGKGDCAALLIEAASAFCSGANNA